MPIVKLADMTMTKICAICIILPLVPCNKNVYTKCNKHLVSHIKIYRTLKCTVFPHAH